MSSEASLGNLPNRLAQIFAENKAANCTMFHYVLLFNENVEDKEKRKMCSFFELFCRVDDVDDDEALVKIQMIS